MLIYIIAPMLFTASVFTFVHITIMRNYQSLNWADVRNHSIAITLEWLLIIIAIVIVTALH